MLQHSSNPGLCGRDSDLDDVMDIYEKRKRSLAASRPPHQTTPTTEQRCRCASRSTGGAALRRRVRNTSSPLGSILAQYKEAEENWTREKASLRREAQSQRQRAHKLDLQNRKLLATHKHDAVDIASLKNALRDRDTNLQRLQERLNKFESVINEGKVINAQQSTDVLSERDELRHLLTASIERLGAAEKFINESLSTSADVEKKLKRMHNERNKALKAASKSRSLQTEVDKFKKRLALQQDILQRVAEIQGKKTRRQNRAVEGVLDFTSAALDQEDHQSDNPDRAFDALDGILDDGL